MRGGMRNAMPEQPADVRNKNFQEVALGYTKEMALDEAQRCLNCPKPRCVGSCPVNIDIPKFIHEVAQENFAEAYKILKQKSTLPAVCGRDPVPRRLRPRLPAGNAVRDALRPRQEGRSRGHRPSGALCCRLCA